MREATRFQNNYHATYAVGSLNGLDFNVEQFDELDYGFDFYAPQSVQNSDRIVFGWVGLPDLTYPTDRYKWHSMLSLPRKISLENGKIKQQPIVKLGEKQAVQFSQKSAISGLDTAYLQISVQNQPLDLKFFENDKGQYLGLRYENGILTLDRTHTEQTELMQDFGSLRHCKIANVQTLECYFDRSILEIFVNGGEKVLTSRFFIENRSDCVESSREIQVQMAKVEPIKFL